MGLKSLGRSWDVFLSRSTVKTQEMFFLVLNSPSSRIPLACFRFQDGKTHPSA